MNVDKPAKSESASESAAESQAVLSDWDDDGNSLAVAEQWRRIRVMVSRAAGVYLILFLGLGLVMSLAGENPLADNGLMPKLLLVFVGLALLIALANTLTDLSREQGRNWLRLVRSGTPNTTERTSRAP
jgi:peptidoglycan/LPS O-acetylase OafA/YrhL